MNNAVAYFLLKPLLVIFLLKYNHNSSKQCQVALTIKGGRASRLFIVLNGLTLEYCPITFSIMAID